MFKRKSLFILLFFLLSLSIFINGCGGGASKEKEPNNSIAEANPITLGTPFEIKIDPVKDIDWFKVDLTQQGYLKVQASQIPENLELEVGFALYEEWEDSKEKWLRKWKRLPDALFVPEAATYYFAIIDNYNDQAANEPIMIKVDFLPEFDNGEPNNNPENATTVEFGKTINPAIYPTGDSDWYKVTTSVKGYISTKVKDVPDELVPNISYAKFDEWADPKVQTIRSWHRLPVGITATEPGDYYIALIDDYNDQSSEIPFSFLIEFIDEMDANEPNDKFEEAKMINRGDTLKLAIFPKNDNDFYKFTNDDGTTLKLMANGQEGIVPELRLYTLGDDNKLVSASGWHKLPAEVKVEPKVEYYIMIHDDYGDQASQQVFEIRIQ